MSAEEKAVLTSTIGIFIDLEIARKEKDWEEIGILIIRSENESNKCKIWSYKRF